MDVIGVNETGMRLAEPNAITVMAPLFSGEGWIEARAARRSGRDMGGYADIHHAVMALSGSHRRDSAVGLGADVPSTFREPFDRFLAEIVSHGIPIGFRCW